MNKIKLEWIEQPAQKSLRFRYESEKRNSKPIAGRSAEKKTETANSADSKGIYPKIKILNYVGEVRIFISCVYAVGETDKINGRIGFR